MRRWKRRKENTMKPILFNTEMVRAILDGRKSVTRRVVKPQHLRVLDSPYHKEHPEAPDKVLLEKLCDPPYHPGDILYVRETFFEHKGRYYYKADGKHKALDDLIGGSFFKWRPSIHMPKDAARLFMRVTNVWVERLQDMTAQDSLDEGVKLHLGGILAGKSAFDPFRRVWDSTIKKADLPQYGWYANPWVWVIEFERISKEEAQKGGEENG